MAMAEIMLLEVTEKCMLDAELIQTVPRKLLSAVMRMWSVAVMKLFTKTILAILAAHVMTQMAIYCLHGALAPVEMVS